jgi:hypothetical protein
MDFDWKEASTGNWVLVGDAGIEATVCQAGSDWRAVWNGASDGKARRLKAKHESPEETMSAAEAAIAAGEGSRLWWPPDDQWQPIQKGYYRKHNGMIISVKRAKSGFWFATNSSATLGRYGRTAWFSTDAEARSAVDALVRGSNEWQWVRWNEAA